MTWDELCDKAKVAAGKAADKINQTTDLAALQVKLKLAERKLTEAYTLLGKAAYKHFSEADTAADKVAEAMTEVEAAQEAVNLLLEQIQRIKAEA